MTTPRRGSVDGLHNLPVVRAESARVLVDGDMLRGVVSFDCDEGWAEILVWNDEGHALFDGENYLTRRVHGVIEVHHI